MILGILQARVSSSRLPGKVLRPILGRPMIECQLERLDRASSLDRLVVATSDEASDCKLAQLCRSIGVDVFRGSLNDVLDRFYQTARQYQPDFVVRLTADCPLIDPTLLDRVVNHCLEGSYDYVSNTQPPTFPDGLDVEICSFGALEIAWREAERTSDREHVTPFIWRQSERFKLGNVAAEEDRSNWRWTVDEPADLEFVRAVYSGLYPHRPDFTTEDILELLRCEPDLAAINRHIGRNEGYRQALQKETEEA